MIICLGIGILPRYVTVAVKFQKHSNVMTFIYLICTVRTGSSAMDMQALPVKDLQWRTSMKLGLMALMGKLLVYLESLMVYMSL